MRDAVAMLDHLKIDKAHLIGLSMGGYTALQVALNHPQRVRSLMLAGARVQAASVGTLGTSTNARAISPRSSSAKARRQWRRRMAAVRAAFNWRSRIRAALPNFRGSFPSTTRKDQRTCRAGSRASVLRSMTSNATFVGLRRRL